MEGKFIPKKPYTLLPDIVNGEEKEQKLYEYVTKEWYKGGANRCAYWHD